jgi:hypothetical protein
MKEYKIKIDEKHVSARDNLIANGNAPVGIRSRLFHSFDRDFLEQQVNEFLDDAIYVSHKEFGLICDISKVEELSGDKLTNYAVILEYELWPF